MPTTKVFTIGYEGKKIEQFLAELKSNNIDHLVDIRIRTGGRKLDFTKKRLSEHVTRNDVGYVHVIELGTPEDLMKDMKEKGAYSLDHYEAHLQERLSFVNDLYERFKDSNIALMCFEKDVTVCHRSVVARYYAALGDMQVEHI